MCIRDRPYQSISLNDAIKALLRLECSDRFCHRAAVRRQNFAQSIGCADLMKRLQYVDHLNLISEQVSQTYCLVKSLIQISQQRMDSLPEFLGLLVQSSKEHLGSHAV